MRRILFVALLTGLLVAIAAPADAREVYNASQKFDQLNAYSWSYDETTGAYEDMYVWATTYKSETWIEYNRFHGEPTLCEGDVPGWTYESYWGSGPATLSGDKNFTSAAAAGTVTGWFDTWTECWYEDGSYSVENGGSGEMAFDVAVQFAGTSPIIREKSSSSFKIPGEWNSHDTFYRTGDSVIAIDGEGFSGYGQYGTVTWKSHYNGK